MPPSSKPITITSPPPPVKSPSAQCSLPHLMPRFPHQSPVSAHFCAAWEKPVLQGLTVFSTSDAPWSCGCPHPMTSYSVSSPGPTLHSAQLCAPPPPPNDAHHQLGSPKGISQATNLHVALPAPRSWARHGHLGVTLGWRKASRVDAMEHWPPR